MKKNIGFAGISFPLLRWLTERLKAAPPDLPDAPDLLEGLNALASGQADSLIVEMAEHVDFSPPETEIRCGELTISPRSRQVTRGAEEISLTPKEFDILLFLARNRGEVFTKEQIYQAVWEGGYLLDDSNIMAFIRKLRKKIEPNPDAPEYILTIWGIGYKFKE